MDNGGGQRASSPSDTCRTTGRLGVGLRTGEPHVMPQLVELVSASGYRDLMDARPVNACFPAADGRCSMEGRYMHDRRRTTRLAPRGAGSAILAGIFLCADAPVAKAVAASLNLRTVGATPIERLTDKALSHNTELAAAGAESDAAQPQDSPAGAPEAVMRDVSIVNAPPSSLSLGGTK